MARKTKISSNPELAKPGKAGDLVKIMQSLAHKRYGVISYEIPNHWIYHYYLAEASYLGLISLDEEVLKIEPTKSNSRDLFADSKLLLQTYDVGISLVVNVVLTVDHLTLSMEFATKTIPTQRIELQDRFLLALENIGFRNVSNEMGYNKFMEILNIRHSIMHPTPDNLHEPTRWDTVPLAWFISEKSKECYLAYKNLITEIIDFWNNKANDYTNTITLRNVLRGVQYDNDVKLPPRR